MCFFISSPILQTWHSLSLLQCRKHWNKTEGATRCPLSHTCHHTGPRRLLRHTRTDHGQQSLQRYSRHGNSTPFGLSKCVAWKEHFQTGKDLFSFSPLMNWSFWSDFKYSHLNRWSVSSLTALFIQHFHLFAITGDPVTIKWRKKISSE